MQFMGSDGSGLPPDMAAYQAQVAAQAPSGAVPAGPDGAQQVFIMPAPAAPQAYPLQPQQALGPGTYSQPPSAPGYGPPGMAPGSTTVLLPVTFTPGMAPVIHASQAPVGPQHGSMQAAAPQGMYYMQPQTQQQPQGVPQQLQQQQQQQQVAGPTLQAAPPMGDHSYQMAAQQYTYAMPLPPGAQMMPPPPVAMRQQATIAALPGPTDAEPQTAALWRPQQQQQQHPEYLPAGTPGRNMGPAASYPPQVQQQMAWGPPPPPRHQQQQQPGFPQAPQQPATYGMHYPPMQYVVQSPPYGSAVPSAAPAAAAAPPQAPVTGSGHDAQALPSSASVPPFAMFDGLQMQQPQPQLQPAAPPPPPQQPAFGVYMQPQQQLQLRPAGAAGQSPGIGAAPAAAPTLAAAALPAPALGHAPGEEPTDAGGAKPTASQGSGGSVRGGSVPAPRLVPAPSSPRGSQGLRGQNTDLSGGAGPPGPSNLGPAAQETAEGAAAAQPMPAAPAPAPAAAGAVALPTRASARVKERKEAGGGGKAKAGSRKASKAAKPSKGPSTTLLGSEALRRDLSTALLGWADARGAGGPRGAQEATEQPQQGSEVDEDMGMAAAALLAAAAAVSSPPPAPVPVLRPVQQQPPAPAAPRPFMAPPAVPVLMARPTQANAAGTAAAGPQNASAAAAVVPAAAAAPAPRPPAPATDAAAAHLNRAQSIVEALSKELARIAPPRQSAPPPVPPPLPQGFQLPGMALQQMETGATTFQKPGVKQKKQSKSVKWSKSTKGGLNHPSTAPSATGNASFGPGISVPSHLKRRRGDFQRVEGAGAPDSAPKRQAGAMPPPPPAVQQTRQEPAQAVAVPQERRKPEKAVAPAKGAAKRKEGPKSGGAAAVAPTAAAPPAKPGPGGSVTGSMGMVSQNKLKKAKLPTAPPAVPATAAAAAAPRAPVPAVATAAASVPAIPVLVAVTAPAAAATALNRQAPASIAAPAAKPAAAAAEPAPAASDPDSAAAAAPAFHPGAPTAAPVSTTASPAPDAAPANPDAAPAAAGSGEAGSPTRRKRKSASPSQLVDASREQQPQQPQQPAPADANTGTPSRPRRPVVAPDRLTIGHSESKSKKRLKKDAGDETASGAGPAGPSQPTKAAEPLKSGWKDATVRWRRSNLVRAQGTPLVRIYRPLSNRSSGHYMETTQDMVRDLLPQIGDIAELVAKVKGPHYAATAAAAAAASSPATPKDTFFEIFSTPIRIVDEGNRSWSIRYKVFSASRGYTYRLQDGWGAMLRALRVVPGDMLTFERWTEDRTVLHLMVTQGTDEARKETVVKKPKPGGTGGKRSASSKGASKAEATPKTAAGAVPAPTAEKKK